jgi:hypothetical protein
MFNIGVPITMVQNLGPKLKPKCPKMDVHMINVKMIYAKIIVPVLCSKPMSFHFCFHYHFHENSH